MLEVAGLTKRYFGVTVVDHVSFKVAPGEVVGYLGPNGSGKTTTIRMLVGLVEPSAGSVSFCGRPIRDDLVGFRRRLGYVPDEPYLYPFLSGRQFLELVGRLREIPARLLDWKIESLMKLIGLSDAAQQAISSYSKGMRQKVLLIAALLHDPDVVVLDEPESGMDVTSILVLQHLVRQLAARGKAVLYSSHLLEITEKVCTRVVVLNDGRIAADDTVSRLAALVTRGSLEQVFAQLALRDDPERVASDIADVAAAQ